MSIVIRWRSISEIDDLATDAFSWNFVFNVAMSPALAASAASNILMRGSSVVTSYQIESRNDTNVHEMKR